MYRTDFWTLWEKARVGCFKRTAWKHVYYLGWNKSPAQAGCMRQVLGPGTLGRPRGIGWRGRWEGGLGWGTHVNPWLIHFGVWQNPLQKKKRRKEKEKKKTEREKDVLCIVRSVHPWLYSLDTSSPPSAYVTIPKVPTTCQVSLGGGNLPRLRPNVPCPSHSRPSRIPK